MLIRIEGLILHTLSYLRQMTIENGENNMAVLDAITAAVTQAETVQASVIALLEGLSKQLTDAIASGDPAAVQALADQITADTAALSAAVTANTPVPPVTP